MKPELCLDDEDRINALESEIERLNSCLKWEQNRAERIGTHGIGCHAWGPSHYECALRELEEMRALAAQRDEEYHDATNDRADYAVRIHDLEKALAGRQEVIGAKDMRVAQLEADCREWQRVCEGLREDLSNARTGWESASRGIARR